MNLASLTAPLIGVDTMTLFDDFNETLSTIKWATTLTDNGTALTGNNRKGVLTILPSDGSVGDDDEAYVASVNNVFLYANSAPIYGRAFIQYTEGDVSHANVCFGFMSTVAANAIVDDGGGPRASGSTAVIYKVDGGTVWRCQTRNNSVSTDTVSTTTAGTASAYTLLEILIHDYTNLPGSGQVQVTFKVNGTFLKDSNGIVIKHTVLVASASAMSLWIGMKNGETVTVETLLVDYLYAHQYAGQR